MALVCSNKAPVVDCEAESFLKDYYIPDYILLPLPEINIQIDYDDIASCPVLVFINSKSGGQLGGQLLLTYRTLLNQNQVNLCYTFTKYLFYSVPK